MQRRPKDRFNRKSRRPRQSAVRTAISVNRTDNDLAVVVTAWASGTIVRSDNLIEGSP
jgi:hypothetical protein